MISYTTRLGKWRVTGGNWNWTITSKRVAFNMLSFGHCSSFRDLLRNTLTRFQFPDKAAYIVRENQYGRVKFSLACTEG